MLFSWLAAARRNFRSALIVTPRRAPTEQEAREQVWNDVRDVLAMLLVAMENQCPEVAHDFYVQSPDADSWRYRASRIRVLAAEGQALRTAA